jgi:hypothetical protein
MDTLAGLAAYGLFALIVAYCLMSTIDAFWPLPWWLRRKLRRKR